MRRGRIAQPTGWARAPDPVTLPPCPSIAEFYLLGRRSRVAEAPPLAAPQDPFRELPPRGFAMSRELLSLAQQVLMVLGPAKDRRSPRDSGISGPVSPSH